MYNRVTRSSALQKFRTTYRLVDTRGAVAHTEVTGVGLGPKSCVLDDRDPNFWQGGGTLPWGPDV
jgi:hypothetical protein